MEKFRDLRKASELNIDGEEYRIAVLGNCATQFIATGIEGYGKLSGINMKILDTDYNQVDAELIDLESETHKFDPHVILLYLATEKIYEEFLDMAVDKRKSFADIYMAKIENYWNLASRNITAKIIQPNFTEIDDKAFGHYSAKVSDSFIFQIRKLNFLLGERLCDRKDVFPLDLLSIQMRLGNEQFFDPMYYYKAKMPIAMNTVPYVAKAVIDIIKTFRGMLKKCVVLDLDNTLWGGVIGDDGIGNIEIGELGSGHAFTNFQRWLRQLKDRGILLAVCSKNNEDVAKEPFETHDEMVLRLSDIAIFVANWEDKASNIRLIQKSLNIGMDSLVFIDDNPFERNLVRSLIPDITVPELPEDPARYLSFLQECNLFETASYSRDDADRTGQYQAEFKRQELEKSYESIDEYLKSLEMVGEAKPFEPTRYARIAQLTQRSNQFNLRTVRYTEDDIARIAEDDNYITLYYTLKDKFGDHGLVAVVIMEKRENSVFIDTWLMSCRVLKRGMEEYIVNKFVEAAKTAGYDTIEGEYIPTEKNGMVKDIYSRMGFVKTSERQYIANVDIFKVNKCYIE